MINRLLPATNSGRCVAALLFGVGIASVVPQSAPFFEPAATIFVRISTFAVLPYMILELLCSIGSLSDHNLRVVMRTGAVAIAALTAIAALACLFTPSLLPQMVTSGFFTPVMLDVDESGNLYDTFFPFNIFKALTEDNYPAIVIVSLAAGTLLQRVERKNVLLAPLDQLRVVISKFNEYIARVMPLGVLALTIVSTSKIEFNELYKLHALPVVTLCGALALFVVMIGGIISVTPLRLLDVLRSLRGPIAVTFSSGSLFIALPMIVESLRVLLSSTSQSDSENIDSLSEQIGTTISIGYALPSVGQVFMISIVPYMAWFIDRPMDLLTRLQMLITAIPTVAGGITIAIRKEVIDAQLPPDVMGVLSMNYEWIARVEKSLSAIGLLALAIVLAAFYHKTFRVHAVRLGATLLCASAVIVGSSLLVPTYLANALSSTYVNDEIVLGLRASIPELQKSTTVQVNSTADSAYQELTPMPVRLDSIRKRGYVRVAVHLVGLPYARLDDRGMLLGHDIDVIQALAQSLNVSIRYYIAPLKLIDTLVASERVDIAIGQFPNYTVLHTGLNISAGYQKVHVAFLVEDKHHQALANAREGTLGRPFVIGVPDKVDLTSALRYAIAKKMSYLPTPADVRFVRLPSIREFIASHSKLGIDAMLTTAEGGATLAILHPEFTMYPTFGRELPLELVMLTAGDDDVFEEFIDVWIASESQRGLFTRLHKHWIQAIPRASDDYL